jgi:hypothetical protein
MPKSKKKKDIVDKDVKEFNAFVMTQQIQPLF